MPDQLPPRDTAGATDIGSGHYLRFHTASKAGVWWSHPECRAWHPLTDHPLSFGPHGEVTAHGSVMCPATGVHGWIIDERWSDA